MTTALAALGSNLGDRAATLQNAIDELRQVPNIQVLAVSRWHETEPIGGPEGQQPFLNGAVLLETSLAPPQLWQVFQQLEQSAARRRVVTWGPRTLDVDLLLYDDHVLDTPELIVPHPRMMFRRFVMEPAAEIAPDLVHPLLGWRLSEINRHLALSRNYVALFAPPASAAKELAEQLAGELATMPFESGAVLSGAAPSTRPAAAYRFSAADCLTNIERQAALVSRARWSEADREADELLLSPFWLGESAIEAAACLPAYEAKTVRQAVELALPGTIRPKLVVCLYQGDSKLPTGNAAKPAAGAASAASRPCGIQLNSEQLQQWRTAARTLLASGLGGPWLMLDANHPAQVRTEVVAATLAMR